jgi:hypothetical protein
MASWQGFMLQEQPLAVGIYIGDMCMDREAKLYLLRTLGLASVSLSHQGSGASD